MPRRSYRPRSKTFRRRSRSRRSSFFNTKAFTPENAYALASKAAKDIWYIKGLINSERMYKDLNLFNNISTSGSVFPLTDISMGDGTAQRTGNSILVRSLSYRYSVEINSSVTNNTRVLMLLVQDTQQIADTTPTITDVLDSSTPESLLSRTNAGRFKVLKRKSFHLTPPSGGDPLKEHSGYLNLYSHVRYNGTTATDIQKGGYYLMFLSSETTNTPTVRGNFRLGYHDN